MISLFLGFALSFGSSACTDDGSADEMNEEVGDGDGDSGDGDGDPGDGDGDSCFPAPEECLRFVDCIGGISPDAQPSVEAEYGAEGSCWCGTEEEAQDCYDTCKAELDKAIMNFPTVQQCHPSSCSLEELDPDEPYGPIQDGACPDWMSIEQVPLTMPLGVPGSVCAPKCSGIANACPEHSQTVADGTCFIQSGEDLLCINYCWVDPTIFPNGTQCQCGATCQQYGNPDGEGNLRGICTFE